MRTEPPKTAMRDLASSEMARGSRNRTIRDLPARNGERISSGYPGAKGGAGVFQKIISQMPPHRLYVEAFAGTGTILKAKRPASCSIAIDIDPRCSSNLAGVDVPGLTVLCDDAVHFLRVQPPRRGDLVYCDPPYLRSVRSCKRDYYRHAFATEPEHVELLTVLRGLSCFVMVSGYRSPLYDRLLAAWRTIDIPTVDRRGHRRIETVWMNFAEPFQLHDYSFLGSGFRERERIKRKTSRWKAKLLNLPMLERSAILAAVSELSNLPSTRVISGE